MRVSASLVRRLARWCGSYPLVVVGLMMLACGSIANGVLLRAPPELLLLGRVHGFF